MPTAKRTRGPPRRRPAALCPRRRRRPPPLTAAAVAPPAAAEERPIIWAASQLIPEGADLASHLENPRCHHSLFFVLVRNIPLLRMTYGPYLKVHQAARLGMLHISLRSVVDFFATQGWHMDNCEALLFVSRLAAITKGSFTTIAVDGGWVDQLLDGRAALLEVQTLVMKVIREGREPELLKIIRREHGAEWTAATHAKLYCTLKADAKNRSDEFKDQAMLAFKALQRVFEAEIAACAKVPETAVIFKRKMTACLPTLAASRRPTGSGLGPAGSVANATPG